MSTSDRDWVPGNPFDRSVSGFRHRHGTSKGPMSKSKYHSLKKAGRAPREMELGGMILITPEAEAEWERVNTAPKGALQRLAQREAADRSRRAKHAGQCLAAQRRAKR
jgi:hypothetical protein